MAKFKIRGHIWGLVFYQYVYFSFHGMAIGPFFLEILLQIKYLTVKIQGHGHD